MHTKFMIGYCSVLLVFAVLLGTNYLYLKHSDEYLSIGEIVQKQQTHDEFCIYGTAIHGNTFDYKLEGMKKRIPDVVVVGSSTVMSFRERFFRAPFYNMGGMMDSIKQGRVLFEAMQKSTVPSVVIIGVDFWWFNEATKEQSIAKSTSDRTLRISKLFTPFPWLIKGKVPLTDYVKTVLKERTEERYCDSGVRSAQKRSGFGPDGSHYYTAIVSGEEESSQSVQKMIRLIEQSHGYLAHGTEISQKDWKVFTQLVTTMKDAGITVVLFAPPLHPQITKVMETYPEAYAYRAKLHQQLATLPVEFFDISNPTTVRSSACEFIDGLHGGDVTAARILKYIEQNTKNPEVRSALNMETINAIVREYEGYAMARDERVTDKPETDFQGIGCEK